MTRSNLMKSLKKRFPKMFLRTTEDFGNGKGGVWTSGEDGLEDENGNLLFDYYQEFGGERLYISGVYRPFANWLEKRGWFCEWYDPGTVMIYPIN